MRAFGAGVRCSPEAVKGKTSGRRLTAGPPLTASFAQRVWQLPGVRRVALPPAHSGWENRESERCRAEKQIQRPVSEGCVRKEWSLICSKLGIYGYMLLFLEYVYVKRQSILSLSLHFYGYKSLYSANVSVKYKDPAPQSLPFYGYILLFKGVVSVKACSRRFQGQVFTDTRGAFCRSYL